MAMREYMGTYIGARYVPRFMGTYDATQAYEVLDVVDNGLGTSYISKIPTPAGTPLTDTTYWALYGTSNGAIINLQNQIGDLTDLDTTDQNNLVDAINEVHNGYMTITDSFVFLISTGDATDRRTDIINARNTGKSIYFGKGDFYVSDTIILNDYTKLVGSGLDTRIVFTNSNATLFELGDECIIDSIKFDGLQATTPGSIGNKNCLLLTGSKKTVKIVNCDFEGFDGYAVNCHTTGGTVIGSLNLVNCSFIHNGVGVRNGNSGEYALINNCTFWENYIGCQNYGGNNRYTACNFGSNTIGAKTDGNGITNSAHGQFIGCSFNHNDTGLVLDNITNGMDIVECLFYIDTIELDIDSVRGGVNIDSCNFGISSVINVAGAGSTVIFRNNTFAGVATLNAAAGIVHGSGNMYGNGIEYNDLNLDLKVAGTQLASKTYNTNSVVTESDFTSGVTVVKSGSTLFVNFNLNFSNLTNSWATIGQINETVIGGALKDYFIGMPFMSQPVSFEHFMLSITSAGVIQLYGYNSTPFSATLRDTIAIPIR